MGIVGITLTVLACFSLVSAQRLTKCTRDEGNPPTGAKCFARGSLPHPSVLRDFYTGLALNPLDTCRDACLDFGPSCHSYSINQADGRCRLYNKSLTSQGFQRGNQPNQIYYWDNTCWKTICVTSNTKAVTDRTLAYDDQSFPISLPFPIAIYFHSTSTAYMSVNGFLSLSVAPGSSYSTNHLPVYNGVGPQNLPDYSVCGFWRDLTIQSINSWDPYFNPNQQLSYTVSGVPSARTITFTWKTTYNSNQGILNMDMSFKENHPNIVYLLYRQVYTDNGQGAIIGAQSAQSAGGQFMEASNTGNSVYQGVQLVLDTTTNTYDFIYP